MCCLPPNPSRLWQGSVCMFDSGLRTSLPRKNYWHFNMCGDFNYFCTNNVLAECNLTQINFEPTNNNKVLDNFLVFCPWNLSTVQTVIPSVSTDHDSVLSSFADSQEWKKSLLFQRPTWMLPPNVLQTSSWSELKLCVQINRCQRSSVSTKFYHVFRISHLLSNSPSDCPWSRSNPCYPCRQTAKKQRNKQLRKQNAAKVKDLNDRIGKRVQKDCQLLDKVGSSYWRTHINSLSKGKQPASPLNVGVNTLNRLFNSFSNDPNG